MEHKFIDRKKKVSLSQIDLKTFFEFYQNFICPYSYNYILEDNTEIILKFEENNFSHLIGLHKFRGIKSYKSSKEINNNILNDKISFENLYAADKEMLDKNIELKDRITYFPVLKTLLENTDTVFKYNINIIWNTKIEFSFLLKSGKITVSLYLAVKEIKNNKKICVPVSLLVDRNNKFIKMKLQELKVKKFEITNRRN